MWKLLLVVTSLLSLSSAYDPTWKSIDSRPLPQWYDEAKLFSSTGECFQCLHIPALELFMKNNYRPSFTYPDFAPQFTTEFFNPVEWAKIFENSGAEYVVLTSKHHEGFTNWPSNYSFNWNSMAVGPKRDLVGELGAAIKDYTTLHFGLYHSLFEWFHPLYNIDKENNFSTQYFVDSKAMPELYEIVNAYKPDVIWSDGDWEATSQYWKSTEFLAWLYNDSPVKDTVVTNDRWGKDTTCKHGGFLTCKDKYNPGVVQKRKFENAMTLDKYSWGYRRNAKLTDFLTMDELLSTFIQTVSCGGNMLMNVGPTKEGTLIPIFQERLSEMGEWLRVNGEGIRKTRPWIHQNDTITPGVWYTMKKESDGSVSVYCFVLKWPTSNVLSLGVPKPSSNTQITLLGYPGTLSWNKGSGSGIDINIPAIPFNKMPCKYVWAFKLTKLSNELKHHLLKFKPGQF
ncbi:hypothetical protein LOTGIDRAFT_238384 [Lottia gigantea]|uniref:alpha-L-fucosidase n=1 Tax=Lottia gigantea TaxID=225164 RepID=V4B156_LOTGI|nr:hypothetical protein LOTGIDRAFT_238384 [Lottia gigantea]ESP01041.1 hypothetical protein LOTGIDRAFT_238384 [Lottia gigantea]